MANVDEIASAFVTHYYTHFDGDRSQLANLYQDNSMVTFEKEKCQGRQNIVTKFANLQFKSIQHQVASIDCQPTSGNGILVFVTGNLAVDGGAQPLKFSQVFNLQANANGQGYYVHNDIFRLLYC
eukprot:TRINITY_DN2173_c0_g1_i1.p1 TRINITY_DN2173_c0_g1~~TRINITY_DN2173_c0_g1_i1.p1  ORF type:complete len:125 (+),score=14.94 TRINITY_DN2173_c0_g1_i1:102-476(+)